MFSRKRSLDIGNLIHVDNVMGVYIVYRNGEPFYAGRSTVSVRDRLQAHVMGRGSSKIRAALARREALQFEWEEMQSPQQAEAQLISALGLVKAGNLRQERDPADKYD